MYRDLTEVRRRPAGYNEIAMVARESWLARIRRSLDRVLAGPAPADPFCVSNRTLGRKVWLACLLVSPLLILAGLLFLGLANFPRAGTLDAYDKVKTPESVSAGSLPASPLHQADLEVLKISIVKDVKPPLIIGVVRNNTGKRVESARISYLLSDEKGSQIGIEVTRVANLGPHDSVTFRTPLQAAQADAVQVREVRAN